MGVTMAERGGPGQSESQARGSKGRGGDRRQPRSLILEQVSAPFASIRSIIGMRTRSLKRHTWRRMGRMQRYFSRGWAPVVAWFVGVVIVLEFAPLILQRLLDWFHNIGLWQDLGAKKTPGVGQWFSVPVLFGVFVGGLAVHALVRARSRVVVDQFVDYTQGDAKAVDGLATLLVAELSSLSQLYREVNDQLSVPLAVGAEQRGGFGRGKEPGTFLTVRADEVSDPLQGSVASEVKVEMAGILIPVGAVLALLGRLVRGPRVLGSVHRTEAGGGPTLTAQIVGRGPVLTWRVDHEVATPAAPVSGYVPTIVSEMAMRMFTDLNFGGGARWRAVQEFTEYLRFYQECLRTPRHRARLLKEAEGRLINAVAEDDGFDLAFYNLGVIYSQLAQEELTSAQSSDVVRWRWDLEPEQIREARIAAATSAFARALDSNPGRWEAHYALAVHRFASMRALQPGDVASVESEQGQALAEVESLCNRVLELQPPFAYADDLLGMALVRLGRFEEGMKHHRRAVRRWWRQLCQAERIDAAQPTPRPTQLLRARANATAALHNLGLAHMSQAMAGSETSPIRSRLSFLRAGLCFRQAAKLAPPQTAAACHFEHGRSREEWDNSGNVALGRRGQTAPSGRKVDRASNSFRKAIRIQPDNPEYRAALARTLAKRRGCEDRETQQAIDAAFDRLAPLFARAVERFPPRSVTEGCTATLNILNGTLDFPELTSARVEKLTKLLGDLQRDLTPHRTDDNMDASIRRLEAQLNRAEPRPEQCPDWERNQVALALSRLYGKRDRWDESLSILDATIARFQSTGQVPQIGRLGLYICRAQAQRHRAEVADEQSSREQLGDALRSAEFGLRIDPLTSAGRREAGRIHFALGQFQDAIDAWTQALSLIPNDPFLHLKLGACYWQIAEQRQRGKGRCAALEEASLCFEESLILSGSEYKEGKAWAHVWLGRVLIERGQFEDAIGQLAAATAFESTRFAASVLLAEAYTAQEQYDAGQATLTRALREYGPHNRNGNPRQRAEEEYVEDLTPDRLRRRAMDARARARASIKAAVTSPSTVSSGTSSQHDNGGPLQRAG